MMTSSTRERAELDLAFDTRRIGRLLADAVDAHGGRALACHILDAKYSPGRRCFVLYQLGPTTVLGLLSWDGTPQGSETGRDLTGRDLTGRDLPAAGMRVYRWPHDPALGTLPAVLGSHEVARALERVFAGTSRGVEHVTRCTVTPVRYRPARRCTVRIDARVRQTHPGNPNRRTLYAKVYHDLGKARRSDAALRALAEAPAMQREHILVPHPVAFLPELALVLCEPVSGVGLGLLLGDRRYAARSVLAAASALAALHRVEPLPAPLRTATFELDRLAGRALRIREHDESLGARMADLTAALTASLPRGGEVTFAHGDCKPSQFLIDRAMQVALLDFDSCRLADPAGDVGAFTAALRRGRVCARLHRTQNLVASLEQDFVAAYCAASGRGPGFRERVRWYEALALVRKAQRAFARAPRSPVPGAILTEALRCLDEAGWRR